MLKAWAQKNGFTIVELLVSIVVIAIIAGIVIVSYSGIQKSSRDSERTSDITLLKIALEKYQADYSSYPSVCPGGDGGECNVGYLETPLKPYLETIPHDIRYDQAPTSTNDYQYARRSTAGGNNGYGLLVRYESKPTCKTGVNFPDIWWGGAASC